MSGYDDRDGQIWMDGKLVNWRDANVHILTHGLHYASSVFEGERAYSGKIFKSREHSERLKASANMIDFEIPWTVDEIEAAKKQVLEANGQTDAYVRAVAWRGAPCAAATSAPPRTSSARFRACCWRGQRTRARLAALHFK